MLVLRNSLRLAPYRHAQVASRRLAAASAPTVSRRALSGLPRSSVPTPPSALPYAALLATLLGLVTVSQLQSHSIELEAPAADHEADFRLDPATSQPFPVVLPPLKTALPSGCKQLQLVGLGVRTVSFLRVRVYVAGLYVDAAALQSLESVPGWKGFQADWMLGKPTDEHSSEALVSALLDRGVTCAIRIVPVRPTDYHHLRDGFTRAIQGRAKLARKANNLTAEADEALSLSLQSLKDAFPKASLPKGKALDLLFAPAGSGSGMTLTLEEDGNVLGSVQPSSAASGQYTVARQLLLAYLANKDEISAPFKQSVAQGFQAIVQA